MPTTRDRARQQTLRAQALRRDAYTCLDCGHHDPTGDTLHADHDQALEHGGAHELSNVRTLCLDCHRRKTRRQAAARANRNAKSRNKVSEKVDRDFSGGKAAPGPSLGVSLPITAALAENARDVLPPVAIPPGVLEHRAQLLAWGLPEPGAEDSWPRLMSPTHPRAVGTYGPRAVAWIEARSGRPLRWWQQLVVFASLEHDVDGALVWPVVLSSTTRQVGKSTTLREVILWRLIEGPRLLQHDAETVLHVAGILDQAKEVWEPAALWAERRSAWWKPRRTNGSLELAHKVSGSRWLVRAASSGGFAFTLTMGVVDEAWKVPPATVDDGIGPALVEPTSSQLWLSSTAHPAATELVPTYRAAMLTEMASAAPAEGLLLEWSARPERRSDDPIGWREASPFWTPRREAFVRSRLEKSTDEASFRCQWLNIWPTVSRRKLADPVGWAAAGDAGEPAAGAITWGAIEVARDGATYGGALGQVDADGTVRVWARQSPRLLGLTSWLLPALVDSGGSLLVSVGLRGQLPISGLPVPGVEVGMEELVGAVANTQALLSEGRLFHDGSATLARQVDTATVVETDRGPHLSAARSTGSVEVVKAMLFVVQACTGHVSPAPAIF